MLCLGLGQLGAAGGGGDHPQGRRCMGLRQHLHSIEFHRVIQFYFVALKGFFCRTS